ncbi:MULTISPECIES: hypothetical protein [Campylobacter]|uniref:Flagella basal body P-ring formation protein FlgA n=1 Tax=Campylobacter magnus TaxID=3026462 RepID=A0ABT8T985_9BACT|nr:MULTISPECIES: hypothetical protein [Campylobacter]MDD7704425.1 hypothetical protein [Campylobacteraceae bacterium]MCI7247385.1 hypothetical protein [Campylobacter sp.]MDD0846440.1 hypothetical protein [Campylobacter magnus]MDO2409749.1 hypothetical protein [Campylobacter magnus]MDY2636254.1 hypothetical protein [Campylobacter sp.]
MIRYLLYTMFFGVLALAQSIADVVVVNDKNSSNKVSSLVEDKIKKMQSVRILDKAILENIQDPFEYDKVSKQDLPALGGSSENAIKVLIGSKIKVGENWLSKGDSIGTTKIVDIKTDSVLLQEKDGNIFTKKLKKGKIDGLEIK